MHTDWFGELKTAFVKLVVLAVAITAIGAPFVAETPLASAAGENGGETLAGVECFIDAHCDDLNDCTDQQCIAGQCIFAFTPFGTPCGNVNAGSCSAGDTCNGSGYCDPNIYPDGTPCQDDGLFCTGVESCQSGVCTSPGDPCAGANMLCLESLQECVFCVDDAQCVDSDDCTDDRCTPTGCVNSPKPDGAPCTDDGIFCTGAETCQNNICVSAGDPCTGTTPFCSNSQQSCLECIISATCDDSKPCTNDRCFGGFCRNSPISAGRPCGDSSSSICDNPDTCDSQGNCNLNYVLDGTACPADSNSCTDDVCQSGMCQHLVMPDGSVCADDGNECTRATCDAGVCNQFDLQDGVQCTDDGFTCTDDWCTSGQCDHPLKPNGAPCSHSAGFCSGPGKCQVGVCQPTGNICTLQNLECDEANDRCVECLSVADCNDGLFCTGNETCVNATCVAYGDPCVGMGLACDELTDQCKCDDDSDCSDGIACTLDHCLNGTCVNSLIVGCGLDCNDNGVSDDCDLNCGPIGGRCDGPGCGAVTDCNANLKPDDCETDCNTNGTPDDCDIVNGDSLDLDQDGVPDDCEPDCNQNQVPDSLDVSSGASVDCNTNFVPDECELAYADCNANGIPDSCDLVAGSGLDCNHDGILNECETDCDNNNQSDFCQLVLGSASDCNGNALLDHCDIEAGSSIDLDDNGIPDECESLVLFVSASAGGRNDGTDWENAYVDLQSALTTARSSGIAVEIWVARGRYTPTIPGGSRFVSFVLVPGVRIYGGFRGFENSLQERNLAGPTNETILSGDLNGDDDGTAANQADNSYHVILGTNAALVLSASGVLASGTNGATNDSLLREIALQTTGQGSLASGGNPAVVDGFSIEDGVANGVFPRSFGGGSFFVVDSPTISNCYFRNNFASARGGAVYNFLRSSPTISNCVFENNKSAIGGAVASYDECSPQMVDCVFHENIASTSGGATSSHFDSNAQFQRCRFTQNRAGSGAGAVVSKSNVEFFNCLMVGNKTIPAGFGGAVHAFEADVEFVHSTVAYNSAQKGGGVYNGFNSTTIAANSIFWKNSDAAGIGSGNAQLRNVGGTVVANFSCVEGLGDTIPGVGNIEVDPLFVRAIGFDGVPGTGDDNLHLSAGSPCIDAGDKFITKTFATDLDGHSRAVNDPGSRNVVSTEQDCEAVDFGAYEWQPDATTTDCDGNGIPDDCELAGRDCNANDLLDVCELAEGLGQDCNQNGMLDACVRPATLFSDRFPSLVLHPAKWSPASTGVVENKGINKPSAPFSLSLKNNTVAEFAESLPLDLAEESAVRLTYSLQAAVGAYGNLVLEYIDASGVWIPLATHTNSQSIPTKYRLADVLLPPEALHGAFAFRFRNDRTSSGWLIDDVVISAVRETDCNSNGYPDDCDLTAGRSSDINFNGIPDECQAIFVDQAADGDNDGTSWCDAFTDLQDALAIAERSDAIYVAKGTYKPSGPFGSQVTLFQLPLGVALYGGYAGCQGVDPNARDFTIYETILSGDRNGDDLPDGSNRSDNSYVLIGARDVNRSTIIEGFTLSSARRSAISFAPGSPTIRNCTFTLNGVHFGRGAAVFHDGGSPLIEDCLFVDNSCNDGGAIYSESGSLTVIGSTFKRNSANDGGAINLGGGGYRGQMTITGCHFEHNTATSEGGAISSNGALDVSNSLFIGNSAIRGGAIKDVGYRSTTTVIGCTFTNNSAQSDGGAISANGSMLDVTNTYIIGNTTTQSGAAISLVSPQARLTNCLVAGNRGVDGGGLSMCASAEISNCTIAENVGVAGGGILIHCGQLDVRNSILFGNIDETGRTESSQIHRSSRPNAVPPIVEYSIIEGLTGSLGGTGNLDDDPGFVSSGYWDDSGSPADVTDDVWFAGDYQLQSVSPAIDAASQTALVSDLAIDIDGNDRFVNAPSVPDQGEGYCQILDMGAYEYQLAVSTMDCNGNGIEDDCEPDCNANGVPDDCDINSEMSEDENGDGIPDECKRIFVDVNANAPIFLDGRTWCSAYPSLSMALQVAQTGDTIFVADGTYAPESMDPSTNSAATFSLKNGVTILGGFAGCEAPDPNRRHFELYPSVLSDERIINGTSLQYIISAERIGNTAVLDGFTITSGMVSNASSAIRFTDASPTIRNCQITGFSSPSAHVAIEIHGGSPTFESCVFADNLAIGVVSRSSSPRFANCQFKQKDEIAAFIVDSSQASFENCMFLDHSWTPVFVQDFSNATFDSCTFSGNTGGAVDAEESVLSFKNCQIHNNNSTWDGGGVLAQNCTLAFYGTTLRGNRSNRAGGAVYAYRGTLSFERCVIDGNMASSYGGGVYSTANGGLRMSNTQITGNTAGIHGGGLFSSGPFLSAANVTFAQNHAGDRGGGYYDSDLYSFVSSSIFWRNEDSSGVTESAQIDVGSGRTMSLDYSILEELATSGSGIGNSQADPNFRKLGYWFDGGTPGDTTDDEWVSGDYRLQSFSPAVNAGNPNGADVLTLEDALGHARIFCDRVDMGAYELGSGDSDCSRSVTLTDYAVWSTCVTGPEIGSTDPTCELYDFDGDNDIDLDDLAALLLEIETP